MDTAALVRAEGPSVVRLDVSSCDARWMGSGFAVGTDLVMTAAHVADQASSIAIQTSDDVVQGHLVALDWGTDSALIRTDRPVTNHPLTLATTPPDVGSELTILGFPLDAFTLRVTRGVLSGQGEEVRYDTFTVPNAWTTDAAINPGNSGGPVFEASGSVVGLVTGKQQWVSGGDPTPAEGTGFVVPAAAFATHLSTWRGQEAAPATSCGVSAPPPAPSGTDIDLRVEATAPEAADISRSLVLHGQSINLGSYESAWQVFTPHMQGAMGGLDRWSQGLSTSFWVRLVVVDVTATATGRDVQVALRTHQDPAHGSHGQTCSDWGLVYSMVNVNGGWLIDNAHNQPGSPVAC